MDNRKISIQSVGRKDFDLSVQLFFGAGTWGVPGKNASYYLEHPTKGFVLFWHEETLLIDGKAFPALKLPYKMGWESAADMVWGWLLEQPNEKYLQNLDHDGSNGKGFHIYNEDWGHVASSSYGIFAVQPIWAWYGK